MHRVNAALSSGKSNKTVYSRIGDEFSKNENDCILSDKKYLYDLNKKHV